MRSAVRRVATAATGLVLGVSASACSGDPQGSAGRDGLLREGELSICINPEYPPMEYLEGNDTTNPLGFDADAARALAKHWDVKVTWQVTKFDGLMPALQARRCDILWSALYLSPERLAVADGTPVLATGSTLLVPAGDSDISEPADLAGRTVAVIGGGANEQKLEDLSSKLEDAGQPSIAIQAYPSNLETVAAVRNGKADALIETDVSVGEILDNSDGELREVPDAFPTDTHFGVFTLKDSPLSDPLAKALKELDQDGTLASLATMYGLDPSHITTSTPD